MTPVDKLLINVREAAALLGVGQRKARELAQEGKLQVVRLGTRSLRLTRESVERLARGERDDNGRP